MKVGAAVTFVLLVSSLQPGEAAEGSCKANQDGSASCTAASPHPFHGVDCDSSSTYAQFFEAYEAAAFRVNQAVSSQAADLHADAMGQADVAKQELTFASILCGEKDSHMEVCKAKRSTEAKDGLCPHVFGPYTVLMQRFSMLIRMKRTAIKRRSLGMKRRVKYQKDKDRISGLANDIRVLMSTLLLLPSHGLDFLESSRWNISSFVLAANVKTLKHPEERPWRWQLNELKSFDTYEDYAVAYHIAAPVLTSWPHDFFNLKDWRHAGGRQHLNAMARRVNARRPTVNVLIFEQHDTAAWDDWQAAHTALLSFGFAEKNINAAFAFTTFTDLQGCAAGDAIRKKLIPEDALQDAVKPADWDDEEDGEWSLPAKARVKALTHGGLQHALAELDASEEAAGLYKLKKWLAASWAQENTFKNADVVLCGEPPFLCPLLAMARENVHDKGVALPIIWRFNRGILKGFPFSEVWTFWEVFHRCLGTKDTGLVVASVGNRFIAEQVMEQTGIRMPYVPQTALWATPDRVSRDDFFLFPGTTEAQLTWGSVLRLFLSQPENAALKFFDMGSDQKVCSMELPSFRSVVLIPSSPAPTHLMDLYARLMPIFYLGEPSLHKYMWANPDFGGFDSTGLMLSMALPRIKASEDLGAYGNRLVSNDHPPFSAVDFLRERGSDFVFQHLETKRYWFQYSEFALLPGLQAFNSVPELMLRLRGIMADNQEVDEIRRVMAAHLEVRRSSALAWWRTALALQLARVDGGGFSPTP